MSNAVENVPETAQPVAPLQPVSRIDFRDAIAQNRRNTIILVVMMLLLAGGFGYVLGWAWDLALGGQMTAGMQYAMGNKVDWGRIIFTPSRDGIRLGLILLSGMALWSAIALWRADKMVLSMADATEVTEKDLPQLHNIVEEIAIAAGLRKPRIVVVRNDMPNAFATGLHSDKAVVGVTTGLLQRLNRRELQGVMAHEMGHVLNGDMRYSTLMAVMTGVLVFVAHFVLQSQRLFMYAPRDNRRDGRSNPFALVILVIVSILAAILVPILARIIQMAISRQREYLADATSVQLTRDPGGLISALQKISESEHQEKPINNALEPLLFMAPGQMLHNGHRAWFSTHPPVERRIERLKALE